MPSGRNIICYLPPGLAAVFLILAAAFALKSVHLPAKADPRYVLPIAAGEPVFPKHLVEIWASALGFLAMLGAALYCHEDIAGDGGGWAR